jgi:hypothetical protein
MIHEADEPNSVVGLFDSDDLPAKPWLPASKTSTGTGGSQAIMFFYKEHL